MVINVMVRCKVRDMKRIIANLEKKGFVYDRDYGVIRERGRSSVIIRGLMEENKISDLTEISGVLNVWPDFKLEPF